MKARFGRIDDERLARLVAGGDEAAFEVLYDRHHATLLAFCRHMLGSREDGEDALQQAFLRAHRALAADRVPDRVRPWLFAIARNRCLTVIAARRDAALPADDVEPSFDGLAHDVERRADLRELVDDLGRLPDDQRGALVLAELGDFSHVEIAGVLGCSPAKVKALVFQARTTLVAERDARRTPCDEIRTLLESARGGILRRGALRRHLRQCDPCAAYRVAVDRRRTGLAIVLPVAPSAGLKAAVLGGGAETAAAAAGVAGSGGLAVVAGGAAAKTLAAKVAVVVALAAGGGAAVQEVAQPERPAPVAASASAPQRIAPAAPRVQRVEAELIADIGEPARTPLAEPDDGPTADPGAAAHRRLRAGDRPLVRRVLRRLHRVDPARARRVLRRLHRVDRARARHLRRRLIRVRRRAGTRPLLIAAARRQRRSLDPPTVDVGADERRRRVEAPTADALTPRERRRRRAERRAGDPVPVATPEPDVTPTSTATPEPRPRRRRPAPEVTTESDATPAPTVTPEPRPRRRPPAPEVTPVPTPDPTPVPSATPEPVASPAP